jgi:ferredoxin
VTGPPEITVLPTGTTVDTEQDETIIAALVRSGYLIRVGCKRGGCGICKVHLLAGEVRYERTVADTVLSDADRAAGICVTCRAVPLTDVVIELQEGDRLRLMSPLLRRAAALTRARRSEARVEPTDG